MKKFIFLALLALTAMLGSCKKHDNDLKPWGKWILRDACMYVTYDNGEKIKLDHFSPTKTVSSLRYDGHSLFDIENIAKNVTTWSFYRPYSNPGAGLFVLNCDTAKHYLVQYTGKNTSIIESDRMPLQSNLGGSARPFQGVTTDYDNGIIAVTIEEVVGSINGRNCNYYTVLSMQRIEEW